MLKGEHSAILSTFIKLPFVIKIFVLSIFEWPLKSGLTVFNIVQINPIEGYIKWGQFYADMISIVTSGVQGV